MPSFALLELLWRVVVLGLAPLSSYFNRYWFRFKHSNSTVCHLEIRWGFEPWAFESSALRMRQTLAIAERIRYLRGYCSEIQGFPGFRLQFPVEWAFHKFWSSWRFDSTGGDATGVWFFICTPTICVKDNVVKFGSPCTSNLQSSCFKR